jgi:hypothetical protein
VHRARAPKLLATIAATLLTLAGLQPALAVDNRSVFFGTPPEPDPPANILLPTRAVTSMVSSYVLRLENKSSATLTQITITGGHETPDPLANPATPPPSTICTGTTIATCKPALPAGAEFVDVYEYPDSDDPVISNDLISCSLTTVPPSVAKTGLRCPVLNMAMGEAVQIRVLVRMPSTAPSSGSLTIWNAVQMKEGSSTSGGNADVKYAVGSVPVTAPDCEAAGTANWFKQGEGIQLALAQACAQFTQISGAGFADQGSFVDISVNNTSPRCVLKLACFGGESEVSIEPVFPPAGAPLFKWTMRWTWSSTLKKVSPKGVVHFHDDFVATDPSTYDVIYFTRDFRCPATPTANCWQAPLLTDNKTFFEVVFFTEENGSGRGF